METISQSYTEMLLIVDSFYEGDPIILQWHNGLRVKCISFTGIYETSLEPGDEDFVGEFAAAVNNITVLEKGSDNTVVIAHDSIEINLTTIPERIMRLDGTVIWQHPETR